MNAQQPLYSPKPNKRRKRSYDHQSKAEKLLAAEVSAKLFINGILTISAIASLAKLLPYYLSQQSELKEVRAEIQDTQTRVNRLNEEFTYYFDARQTQSQIKKYQLKVEPNERYIFWVIEEKMGTEE
ncbi:hypothetical protein [Gloeocapsa sp. PCC 73106]|uniref:slr1601 family putative cell division protein n=1 Tax=Gloeocapsa sp. PCC 73106 TaxID=102232 RepID=UPI0002AD1824|nr:hypothetical protein [Gloeocapsa sp. PCC 73106]ELR97295.1 hypothetical protein GLO73106DRAFT_00011030 [Gloeocapsa sp. PCC 73106]